MGINIKHLPSRRSFLGKGVAAFWLLLFSSCRPERGHSRSSHSLPLARLEDLIGSVTPFPVESVVLIRDDAGIAAMSLTCSHMQCQLAIEETGLRCPCHGAFFSLDGVPQRGPATEPLEFYTLSLDSQGMLLIDKSKKVDGKWRLLVSG